MKIVCPFISVPSGAPSSVNVTSITPYSLTFSISLPLPQHRNGIILRYSLQLTQSSNGRQLPTYTTRPGWLLNVSSLTPYTTYSYVVAAQTVNGTGPYGRIRTVTTAETGKVSL